MAKGTSQNTRVTAHAVERYLRAHGYPRARVVRLEPLGVRAQEGLKDFGYGRPLRVTFTTAGESQDLVVRTMTPDLFGHNRRADRIDNFVLAFDTFNHIPKHIRALDIGTFSADGELVPFSHGEPFLLTTYEEGEIYAHDLAAIAAHDKAAPRDLKRAEALARYLGTLHKQKADPGIYTRALRDTLASGEGLLGQAEGYPDGHPSASPQRLMAIELAAVQWRWKLRTKKHRARRTHGDFHPFNVLFREDVDFSVLDCSRGGAGEPADDLTCMAINYLFFALTSRHRFDGSMKQLWDVFFESYFETNNDTEILGIVAPFFAWRALVLASPIWYPKLEDKIRQTLLRFAERLLAGEAFLPHKVLDLL